MFGRDLGLGVDDYNKILFLAVFIAVLDLATSFIRQACITLFLYNWSTFLVLFLTYLCNCRIFFSLLDISLNILFN